MSCFVSSLFYKPGPYKCPWSWSQSTDLYVSDQLISLVYFLCWRLFLLSVLQTGYMSCPGGELKSVPALYPDNTSVILPKPCSCLKLRRRKVFVVCPWAGESSESLTDFKSFFVFLFCSLLHHSFPFFFLPQSLTGELSYEALCSLKVEF